MLGDTPGQVGDLVRAGLVQLPAMFVVAALAFAALGTVAIRRRSLVLPA